MMTKSCVSTIAIGVPVVLLLLLLIVVIIVMMMTVKDEIEATATTATAATAATTATATKRRTATTTTKRRRRTTSNNEQHHHQSRLHGHLCPTDKDKDNTTLGIDIGATAAAVIYGGSDERDSISDGASGLPQTLIVGKSPLGIRRTLLYFHFNQSNTPYANPFPKDARIECVELALAIQDDRDDSAGETTAFRENPQITLYQLTSPWAYSTQTPPTPTSTSSSSTTDYNKNTGVTATPGHVTWDYSNYPSDQWHQNGGDFQKQHPLSKVSYAGYHNFFGSSPGINHLVQGWMKGEISNYGFLLKGEEDAEIPPSVYGFYHGVIQTHTFYNPRLFIRYTAPSLGKPYIQTQDQTFHHPDLHGGLKQRLVDDDQTDNNTNDAIIGSAIVLVGILIVLGMILTVRRSTTGMGGIGDTRRIGIEEEEQNNLTPFSAAAAAAAAAGSSSTSINNSIEGRATEIELV